MKTYIANFGRANSSWPDCLRRSTVAVLDGVNVHPFWERGDREGYIAEAQRTYRSRVDRPVITPVASRWFNLNDILRTTTGDLWIHREKEEVWWTISTDGPAEEAVIEDPHPVGGFKTVHISHKPCNPWSDRDKKGARLLWPGIHPKAREFLFTESTFQQLAPENALYAQALIDGRSLEQWHQKPDWRLRVERARKGAVTNFDAIQRAAAQMLLDLTVERMAQTAFDTAAQSGRISVTQTKLKIFSFIEQRELEEHAVQLYRSQEGLCALTGLEMLLDASDGNPELRCSLDRINSNGHYERGNLQIVCKFANRWKGASDDDGFKKLIDHIRSKSDEGLPSDFRAESGRDG